MRPILGHSDTGRLAGSEGDIRDLFRRPAGGGVNVGPWVAPTLLNSWTNAGAPYEDIAYRWLFAQTGDTAELEFRGHITGGATDTVAFTLDPDYLFLAGDVTFLTDVIDSGVPTAARVYIDMGTGDVTVSFPV
jgi:hypothetical protein